MAIVALTGPPTLAAPGDLHRIKAEMANLRAGPSDQSNVRGRVEGKKEVIELAESGKWVGVRVLDTGEEGWIFGDLLDLASASTLGEGTPPVPPTAGFRELSAGFDQVMQAVNTELGQSFASKVETAEGNKLRVVADPDWLRSTSRDAHIMAATALYEMWKNHQNSAAVEVTLLDGKSSYVTISDDSTGPKLTVTPLSGG
jgi:hypothetical protein